MTDTLGAKMSSKIVNFDFESDKIMLSKLNALPDIVKLVHERSQMTLLQKLKAYFDHVDDALFESADKAFSSQDQNVFFDAMRELRVQRQGIEKRFITGVGHAFIDLLQPNHAFEAPPAEVFTCDALSLVGNDDLEEMVALDTSVSNANTHYGESIQHVSLRLDSLLPVKIYQKNNPLGPTVLCQIFMAQVKRLDIDLKAKLIVFKLFDRELISNLDDLYQNINQTLIDSNILPSLSAASTRRQSEVPVHHRTRVSDTSKSSSQAPNIQGLHQAHVDHVDDQDGVSVDVINMLRSMLSHSNPNTDNAIPATLDALSKIQAVCTANIDRAGNGLIHHADTGDAESVSSHTLIDHINVAQGNKGKINSPENQIIHLVAMLFDFVLDDETMDYQLKSLIIKLQIPLTKLALIDKSFLIDNHHIARQLLNAITQAALRCEIRHNEGKSDHLYIKIKEVVALLLMQFDDDTAIFNQAFNDFQAFLEKEARRASLLEKRTLDAEDGKAKAEVARITIAIEIELRIVDKKLPKVAVVIIEKAWRNYLFITALKYGFNTLQWRSALSTMDDLVLSVQPLKNDSQRSNLIHLAPNLLKKLQHGFDAISYNPYDTVKIFKVLEHIHLKLIRGKAVEGFTPIRSASITKSHTVASTGKNKKHNKQVHNEPVTDSKEVDSQNNSDALESVEPQSIACETVENCLPAIEQHDLDTVEAFSKGAWFEMHINDTTIVRCRLAAFIKATDKYIFVNRNGMKVTEKTKQELAAALRDQKIKEINNTVLFDRALEAVVSSMRKNKQTN